VHPILTSKLRRLDKMLEEHKKKKKGKRSKNRFLQKAEHSRQIMGTALLHLFMYQATHDSLATVVCMCVYA
jgi:hypothetical protein